MQSIYKNLYQFSVYIPNMDFTIHQYLLACEPSVLFATGTLRQASNILPQIKDILNGRQLRYIFVSHVESDECGGIFYSADLMLRFGNGTASVINGNWRDEVFGIDEKRIPVIAELEKLKQTLRTVNPKFVAVGHGFV